jgi:hypothetical protein
MLLGGYSEIGVKTDMGKEVILGSQDCSKVWRLLKMPISIISAERILMSKEIT